MSSINEIKIEKLCINIGVGEAGDKLNKAKKLLERLTGKKAVITIGKKKIPTLGVRPGLPIGVKITLRKNVDELLKRLIESKEMIINKSSFTSSGVSFGVDEYLHIPGVDYDPEIGIMGLDVTVVLEKPGYRIKKRSFKTSKVGVNQLITVEDSIKFMTEKYGVIVK
ncbi:MAG: 50S ribosomal protein L5 [Candidatus Nanoarchaeia archaeon]|jgi:large subunit ribosomal protein L5